MGGTHRAADEPCTDRRLTGSQRVACRQRCCVQASGSRTTKPMIQLARGPGQLPCGFTIKGPTT